MAQKHSKLQSSAARLQQTMLNTIKIHSTSCSVVKLFFTVIDLDQNRTFLH